MAIPNVADVICRTFPTAESPSYKLSIARNLEAVEDFSFKEIVCSAKVLHASVTNQFSFEAF